tara:strand:- start:18 stop:440 length:423 start_codon:yes stop_codon:yes gene_type:complete
MAATVYNGVLQGTGAVNTQVLYTNSTGKNVRIVWNFFKVGNTHPSELGIYFGPSSNPNHNAGQDLDTILISSQANFTAGKSLAVQRNDDNTSNHAYGSYGGSFPMELMLLNGSKISVLIPAQISSNTNALSYNFVAITED